MNIDQTFGDVVKRLREERNLPLREVADYLQIDTSMLGKIEKNSRKPTKQLIEKFAEFFNVSDKDLMIAFLSDSVASQLLKEGEVAYEVIRVAEQKVKDLNTKKTVD